MFKYLVKIYTPNFFLLMILFCISACSPSEGEGGLLSETAMDNSLPLSPNELTLVSPQSLVGDDSTPTIRIEAVNPGDEVSLYIDSSCTQKVGSAIATSNFVEIVSSVLSSNGTYTFYANSSNLFGTSECSSSSITYELRQVFATINAQDLSTKRQSFVDCGQSQETLQDKISHCAGSNDGATVDVGNEKLWKLVTKLGGDEFWLDVSTGLVWGPDEGQMDWYSGFSFCQGLSSSNPYGFVNESFYMPSGRWELEIPDRECRIDERSGFKICSDLEWIQVDGDVHLAEQNSFRSILIGHSEALLWTASNSGVALGGASNSAWYLKLDTGELVGSCFDCGPERTDAPVVDETKNLKSNTYSVRCVFDSLK